MNTYPELRLLSWSAATALQLSPLTQGCEVWKGLAPFMVTGLDYVSANQDPLGTGYLTPTARQPRRKGGIPITYRLAPETRIDPQLLDLSVLTWAGSEGHSGYFNPVGRDPLLHRDIAEHYALQIQQLLAPSMVITGAITQAA